MTVALLPDHITADELTITTVLTITDTARSTRWVIATMGEHEEEGLVEETAKPIAKGKLPAAEYDDEWAAAIIEAIAAHGWRVEDERDIEVDTPIRLARA